MKTYKCSDILYVPDVLENRSVAIGIIMWDAIAGSVAAVKRTDWSPVQQLDADADIEFLSAAVDHVEELFRQAGEAEKARLIAQFSLSLTLSDPVEIETDEPAETLKQLAHARGL